MTGGWRAELARNGAVAGAGALAGAAVGEPWAGLAAGGLACVAYHLWRLRAVERWLSGARTGRLPPAGGAWGRVHERLERLRRRDRGRRRSLRRLLGRFRSAADAAPDAVVLLGPEGRIEWMNPAAGTLLGLHDPEDRRHPVTHLVRDPALAARLATGTDAGPFAMRSPVDPAVHLAVHLTPYGRERRLLLARDVTRLQRLEEMRRDFVANVSHELRSPLTVIAGYVETLGEDPRLPDHVRRPVEQMAAQTARMCALVEDLLRLSRLENDPGEAGRTPVDVAALLGRARTDALALGGGRHRVVVDAEPDLWLLGDPDELYSAVSNLAFNAVQYTAPEREIRIAWHAEGAGACLSVADEGAGIDPVHLPRLTERFYRVDKARSRALGGTGLGLAIVKHVLVRHGARLAVESAPGRGSVFRCHFPAGRVERGAGPAGPGSPRARAGHAA